MARTLQVVWLAMIASLIAFTTVASVLGPRTLREAPPEPVLAYVLAAVALSSLVAGIVAEKVLLAKAEATLPMTGHSPAAVQTVFLATLVGGALRESAGLIGGVITLLTGERLWALALGGAAILSLLAAWPRLRTGHGIEPE